MNSQSPAPHSSSLPAFPSSTLPSFHPSASPRPLGREEQARLEVGRTDVGRGPKLTLVIAFLALIFAVPAAQLVHERRSARAGFRSDWCSWRDVFAMREAPRREAAEAPAEAGALRRAWEAVFDRNARLLRGIKDYEDALTEESLLTSRLLPPAQAALTGFLGAGNEKAYVGRDGWLFYRPDVDYVTAPGFLEPRRIEARARSGSEWQAAPQPDPALAILSFRRQLAARGITLVVMPTPVKPVVHPEMFSARYAGRAEPLQNASYPRLCAELAAPAKFFARFDALLAPGRDMPEERARRQWFWPLRQAYAELTPAREELERSPVLVFDPAGELVRAARESGRPQYLATDTHWRPEAMTAVARGLAEFVRENVRLPFVPRQAWRREKLSVTNPGDIAVMMKLPAGQRLYPPETAELAQLYLGQGEAQRQWRPEVGADVLLLGDSFSNIYSAAGMGWGEDAGLAEQLSFELGRPVDALVRNDSGAYATREMLSRELARGFDRLAGKRVVIWQFAARELVSGDWRLEGLGLDLGKPRASGFLEVEEGRQLVVTGTVREASPAPRPGAVTYSHHVIHAHLADLAAEDGAAPVASEAVVAVYSMRDQVWTAAARWRPGERVRLRLSNYQEVNRREKIGSVKSSMLSGEAAFETPCWAEDLAEPPAGGAGVAAAAASGGPLAPGWPELAAALGVLAAAAGLVLVLDRREARGRLGAGPGGAA